MDFALFSIEFGICLWYILLMFVDHFSVCARNLHNPSKYVVWAIIFHVFTHYKHMIVDKLHNVFRYLFARQRVLISRAQLALLQIHSSYAQPQLHS